MTKFFYESKIGAGSKPDQSLLKNAELLLLILYCGVSPRPTLFETHKADIAFVYPELTRELQLRKGCNWDKVAEIPSCPIEELATRKSLVLAILKSSFGSNLLLANQTDRC